MMTHPEASDEEVKLDMENVQGATKVLEDYDIRIANKDVGGQRGRKMVYHTRTNEVVVAKVDRIRRSDWYPFSQGDESTSTTKQCQCP